MFLFMICSSLLFSKPLSLFFLFGRGRFLSDLFGGLAGNGNSDMAGAFFDGVSATATHRAPAFVGGTFGHFEGVDFESIG